MPNLVAKLFAPKSSDQSHFWAVLGPVTLIYHKTKSTKVVQAFSESNIA